MIFYNNKIKLINNKDIFQMMQMKKKITFKMMKINLDKFSKFKTLCKIEELDNLKRNHLKMKKILLLI